MTRVSPLFRPLGALGPLGAVRRGSRAAALLVAVGSFAAAAASCRDIVTNDVVDAEAALCDGFEACGLAARACRRVETFFEQNDEATWESYLAYYQLWDCGEGCGSVDICLDFPQLCTSFSEPCKSGFDCCFASSGVASCSDAGLCCVTLGVPCETASDCCALETDGSAVQCFARTPEATRTCGGVTQCAYPGDECSDETVCCGRGICDGSTCVPSTCVDHGDPCKGAECCIKSDVCDDTCQARGNCETDPKAEGCCGSAQQPCTVGNPGGDVECCGGLTCRTLVSSSVNGICVDDGQCGPLGIACTSDDECCENGADEIHCLGIGFDSAAEDARFCQKIRCQLDVGERCTTELQCCAGLTCSADEDGSSTCKKPCDPASCHDVRSFGQPIDLTLEELGCEPGSDDPTCNDGCTLPAFQAECVAEICAIDDFCCCAEWDPVCIDKARTCLIERGGEP